MVSFCGTEMRLLLGVLLLSFASAEAAVPNCNPADENIKQQVEHDDTFPFGRHRQQNSLDRTGFLTRDVERVSLRTMDRETFLDRFSPPIVSGATQPVVITDVYEGDVFDATAWSREAFAKECGDNSIYLQPHCDRARNGNRGSCHNVRRYVPQRQHEGEFAGLDVVNLHTMGIRTVRDFLTAQDDDTNLEGQELYMFNAKLCHFCPSAMERVQYPYFIAPNYDVLRYKPEDGTEKRRKEANSFELFIGKKGTGTALHTDSGNESTWSQAMSGRKLWRLFPPSEQWRLYPTSGQEDSYHLESFHANVMDPDFVKYPLLNGTIMYEALLQAGEGILVPQGWSHQVLNLDDAITFAVCAMQWKDVLGQRDWSMYESNLDGQDYYDDPDNNRFKHAFFFPLNPLEHDGDEDGRTPAQHFTFQEMVASHHLTRETDWTMEKDRLIDRIPETVLHLQERMTVKELDAYRTALFETDPLIVEAVEFHFVALIRYMIEVLGMNINERGTSFSGHPFTALDLAIEKGYTRLADFLKENYQAMSSEELEKQEAQEQTSEN